MDCWYCGHELIWNGDFDAEDYGYEKSGVISTFTCPDCGAEYEGRVFEEEWNG